MRRQRISRMTPKGGMRGGRLTREAYFGRVASDESTTGDMSGVPTSED